MDIEKLIEQLNNLEFVAYGYNINGEVLGMECTEFECLMVDASTALSTLQAENEKLRAELEHVKRENNALWTYIEIVDREYRRYMDRGYIDRLDELKKVWKHGQKED